MRHLFILLILALSTIQSIGQSEFKIFLNKNGHVKDIDKSYSNFKIKINDSVIPFNNQLVDDHHFLISVPKMDTDSNTVILFEFEWKRHTLTFDCTVYVNDGNFNYDSQQGIAFCFFTNKKKLFSYLEGYDNTDITEYIKLPVFVTSIYIDDLFSCMHIESKKSPRRK